MANAVLVIVTALGFGGAGVDKDYNKAFEWYSKSAAQGNSGGQRGLGSHYHLGHGVARDYKATFEWYSKSAAQGDVRAQICLVHLGVDFYCGREGEKDYARAFECFCRAVFCPYRHALCEVVLGECYFHGHGVKRDYKQAYGWFLKSALQGCHESQHRVGECFFHGFGVDQDFDKAFEWYCRSALQGDHTSQYSVGECDYSGLGVGQDYESSTTQLTCVVLSPGGSFECYMDP